MIRRCAALTTLLLGFLLGGPAAANDKVYYYSSDTLQSEVVITDANRNVVERTYYAPYGQVLNRALRDGPGYTGHEEDPESSLVYMQQRYFDPVSGRFLSSDPVATTDDGGGFNRYVYANDNPYRYTDPTGAEGVGKEWLDYTLASANAMGTEPLSRADQIQAGEFIGGFVPVLAEGLAIKDFVNKPSWLGAGIVAASFIDLGGVAKGIGDGLKVGDKALAGGAKATAKEGIYEFTAASGKTYVGQSVDIATRIDQHLASGKLLEKDLTTLQTTEVLGGKTAREVAEQLRINQLGGIENLENIRNPIGPARQYLLQDSAPP